MTQCAHTPSFPTPFQYGLNMASTQGDMCEQQILCMHNLWRGSSHLAAASAKLLAMYSNHWGGLKQSG